MAYPTQKGTNHQSCGALSACYALDILGLTMIHPLDKFEYQTKVVLKVWNHIKFPDAVVNASGGALEKGYSDPTLIAKRLRDLGAKSSTCYLSKTVYLPPAEDGKLRGLLKHVKDKYADGDGLAKLFTSPGKLGIGMYKYCGGYHYVLSKYTKDGFQIMDSNDPDPHWEAVNQPPAKTFTAPVDGKNVSYTYSGLCIIVAK